jgi:type II secretory pathway component PulF
MTNVAEPIIEREFKRTAGICLLFGALLATLAMTLHLNGGDIEHVIKIKSVLAFSHSIAIFCLPFIGFGFWGLSKILETKSKISTLAFFIFSFGLFAAMVAATINGLTLPNFASNYSTNDIEISTIKKIIDYGKFINIPMAVIFIAATSLSVGLWAFLIIQTSKLPKWIGYFGLMIIAFGGVRSNTQI